jgi:hypothetical protein
LRHSFRQLSVVVHVGDILWRCCCLSSVYADLICIGFNF